jgi:hypothetical protein
MRTTGIDFEKFVKKRTIVDHGLTHFLGAGFPSLFSQRERSSGAVVLNYHRVVNGQVVRTPIEVFERIATGSHHLGDELIRFGHGAVRIVDKAGLNATPLSGKRIGLILSELAQVETADAIGALPQHRVGMCGTDSLDGSFVLGSKAFAQVYAPAAARVGPRCKHEQQDNNTDTDEHEGF